MGAQMRIPLVRPNMPKLAEVQEYYQLAEKHGQYSNFGLCYDIAVSKLQKVYPGSHPVLVNNGTTAIQVALQASLPRGSRVALPTFTFTATLNAVVAAGMVPVLFDVSPVTWQIDQELLRDKVGLYDAFIVVSPFGYAVDTKVYDQLANELSAPVIYDFAPAWGHPISKEYPTTFSFHATKTLPIGEGGSVMMPFPSLQEHARRLINFDFDNQMPQSLYGMNGKMDELHCAVLCAQLDRNENHLLGPKLSEELVRMLVNHSGGVITAPYKRAANHLQLPVVKAGVFLKDVMEALMDNGIACKEYYKPHLHEVFTDLEFISEGGVYTPIGTLGIARPSSYAEAETIANIIFDAVRK
jgi:dTDP-4-amino-4,6-dideoxygalactose transaminase